MVQGMTSLPGDEEYQKEHATYTGRHDGNGHKGPIGYALNGRFLEPREYVLCRDRIYCSRIYSRWIGCWCICNPGAWFCIGWRI